MDETTLNELADTVADILDKRSEVSKDALATIGTFTVFAGIGYVGMRMVRNVVDARRYRKLARA